MAAAARGAGASAAPLRRTSFGKVEQAATSVMEHTTEFEAFESLPCGVGDLVTGPLFEAGGHEWRLAVNPGGDDEAAKQYVSAFLYYAGTRDSVSASYDIEITHSACPGKLLGRFRSSPHLYATHNDASKGWGHGRGRKQAFKRSALDGKTGTLTMKCVLTVAEGERRTSLLTGPQNLVAVPPPSLGGTMKTLLDAGTLSDVVLQSAEDQTAVKAHRLILTARSPVFAAMFTGGMAEAKVPDGALAYDSGNKPLSIAGVSGVVLKSLVHFIYVDELSADADEHLEGLLAAADQYQLPRLVSLCEEQLCAGITTENAAARLVVAELHSAAQLMEHCLDYISEQPAEVMATEGWQQLGTQPNLLQQLFAHKAGVRKRPRDEPADEPGSGALTAEKVRGMKVGELRAALQERGLESSGLKAALVARLQATLD
jgi:speckle-type POZ protein